MSPLSRRTWLERTVTVLLAAAILSGVFLRFYKLSEQGLAGSDTIYYTNIAKSWSDGDITYQLSVKKFTYRPVVFFFFATAIKVLGYQDDSIKKAMAAADTANVLLIFLICYLLSRGSLYSSLSCATVYALSPWAVHYARIELGHTLSAFLVLLSFLFFVLHHQALDLPKRYSWLALSGVFTGLAALTHEELILIAGGYLTYLLVEQALSAERRSWRPLILKAGLLVTSVLLVCHRMILLAWSQAMRLTTASGESPGTERLAAYLGRLARFGWNFITGNSSPAVGYLLLVAILSLALRAAWKIWKSRNARTAEPPVDLLAIAVLTVYLAFFAFFFTKTFPRIFVPLFPLVLITITLGYSRILSEWLSPNLSQVGVSCILLVTLLFNLNHYGEYRGRKGDYQYNSDLWAPYALYSNLDLSAAWSFLLAEDYSTSWNRLLYDALKEKVREDAKLLVTPSIMYPYAGRRALQVGFYFGDNAIYAIDHREPLSELISRYDIRYVLFTDYRADRRVEKMKEYERYLYGGRWSSPEPLTLGASYGFQPGEYSLENEHRFLERYLQGRGAKILFANGRFQTGERPQGFRSEIAYVVYEVPESSQGSSRPSTFP